MADTFSIREETSDESILAALESRGAPSNRPRRRNLDFFSNRDRERRVLPEIETVHELMDLLLFATIVLLWTSGMVMVIFGGFLLKSEYGLSVLVTLEQYAYTMFLQCLSAFTILLAAGITTSLLSLDEGIPKRAIIAFSFVIISMIVLVAEIIVGKMAKDEINEEVINVDELKDSPPAFLSEEAGKKGLTCRQWNDGGCESIYKAHASNYANYLIGSASVALAIDAVTLPIYIFVNRVTVKDIAEGTLRISSHVRFSETPSLLSVNSQTSPMET